MTDKALRGTHDWKAVYKGLKAPKAPEKPAPPADERIATEVRTRLMAAVNTDGPGLTRDDLAKIAGRPT